jgi:hypothetical protein
MSNTTQSPLASYTGQTTVRDSRGSASTIAYRVDHDKKVFIVAEFSKITNSNVFKFNTESECLNRYNGLIQQYYNQTDLLDNNHE